MLPHTLPDKLIKDADFARYFENLAWRHKDISHTENKPKFYMRVDDVEGINVQGTIMLVIREATAYGNTRDAIIKTRTYTLWIMKVLGKGDAARSNELVDECEVICEELLAQLIEDSRPKAAVSGDTPFSFFKELDCNGQALDSPMFDSKYVGWELKVSLGQHKQLKTNAEKWR